jgi:hypothetical protein
VRSPDDDNTTAITETTNTEKQSFDLQQNYPGIAILNSVSVRMRTRDNDGAIDITHRCFLLLGGNTTNGTTRNTGVGSTAYSDWTETLARPGGGSWSKTDLATLEVGVEKLTGGATLFCTTLYVTIDYTPPIGGFALFVGSVLPPLLAAASHALLKREFDAVLGRVLSREEFHAARAAFARRPRFAF